MPLSSSAFEKDSASSKVTKPNPLDLEVSRSVITRAVNKKKFKPENKFCHQLYKCEVVRLKGLKGMVIISWSIPGNTANTVQRKTVF